MTYLIILLPFLVLILLNVLSGKVREEMSFWLTGFVLAFQTIVTIAAALMPLRISLGSVLGFNLTIDNLSLVLLFSVGLVGLAALMVGHFTIKNDHIRFNLKNLLLVALIGINGIAMVKDIFSLYVFLEVTALATFILITLYKDKVGFEGAWKYLILSVVASTLMLTSIALFLMVSGGTSFAVINAALGRSNPLWSLALILFICGLFIKGGLAPFHGWLPDAYTAAPASVSVFLAGIVTKAAGIFSLIRILTVLGAFTPPIKALLLLVGTASILMGALAALQQRDMKRLLAYSSISQMGYIIVALGCGTRLGLIAALFHFLNHAIFKAQLFANAAAVEEQLGTDNMDRMGGLGGKMPVTSTTSIIASLSTAGIPPLSGFWSKLLIVIALWMAGYQTYAVIAVLVSVLTLAYFLSMQRRVFFGKLLPELSNIKEASWGLLLPVVCLSAITVGLGLVVPFFWQVLIK